MTLRIGILGGGSWAHQHLAAIAAVPDAEVVALAELDPTRAARLAHSYGIDRWFTDPLALLDEAVPDAVVVVTPSPTHASLAAACADRGIAVLVEKPVCRPGEEQLVRDAAAKVPVQPGHVLRFAAPYVELAARAADPAWGPITGLVAQRHRGIDHITSYPETHVVDLTMVHDIDLALWLLDSPIVEVRADVALPTTAAPTLVPGAPPALAQAQLTTVDGRIALLRASWVLPADGGRDLLVAHGAGGDVSLVGTARPGVTAVDIEAAMAAEWVHFADCVRRRVPPTRVTVEDALAGLAVAEAIKASADAGGIPVALSSPSS